jgi:putative glycosyltransferase (TIGR04348 family)
MRIGIVTPAPPGSKYGNRVTALRWARLLKELGHRVQIKQEYGNESFDLLVALHAKRSHSSIVRFHEKNIEKPLIVTLTGTDLYQDLSKDHQAQESLELASRIVVLQPKALDNIKPALHHKVHVIYQSVSGKSIRAGGSSRHKLRTGKAKTFDICVIGHLRPVKDPFRAAQAARLLPSSSRIRILHIGSAMTKDMEEEAQAEMRDNSRYRWFGGQPQWRAYRLLSNSDLCILSSLMEGGANLLSEAIVARVPVLASRIAGSIGILGENYPGYFSVGNTHELAQLMIRAETELPFIQQLLHWSQGLTSKFLPACEKMAWRNLLTEL